MVQHFFVLIGKSNIAKLYFRLPRLCLGRQVLLTSIGEFWLIQYRFNAIQCRVHYSQARCLAIECFQRSKQIKYEQKNAKNISQGKAAFLSKARDVFLDRLKFPVNSSDFSPSRL